LISQLIKKGSALFDKLRIRFDPHSFTHKCVNEHSLRAKCFSPHTCCGEKRFDLFAAISGGEFCEAFLEQTAK